jgi:hypothetical protein
MDVSQGNAEFAEFFAASPPGLGDPHRTELFIGNFDLGHTIFAGLIYTGSPTCSNGQLPPAVDRLDRPPPAGHS